MAGCSLLGRSHGFSFILCLESLQRRATQNLRGIPLVALMLDKGARWLVARAGWLVCEPVQS